MTLNGRTIPGNLEHSRDAMIPEVNLQMSVKEAR